MKNKTGFTLVEVFAVLVTLLPLALGGCGVYVLWHFISKFW